MYTGFKKYLQEKNLLTPGEKVLLAVSGGIDSMVMSHLFLRHKIPVAVAHCNFGLRNQESFHDEMFVKQWAETQDIPFFHTRFDTEYYANMQGISTQMAARDLRYNWFNEIMDTQDYDKLAVAHHADDNIETILLNLTRGTGIKGACGIMPLNGRIIRPLLFATRAQITHYATEHHITYREDRSNDSDDYTRNYIRHHIVPKLKILNPSLADTFRHNSEYFIQIHYLLTGTVEKNKAAWCINHHNEWRIDIKALLQTAASGFWLFELLKDFGFNSIQINDINKVLEKQSGKRFFSSTHELVKDRDNLLIIRKEEQISSPGFEIKEFDTHCITPIELILERLTYDPASKLPCDKNIACIDADKLHFPLLLRPWQKGDSFIPLGMKGKKKLSDYFIDCKIPLPHKTQQWVIVSNNNIVWIVGQRLDERYKIRPQTKNMLKITWNANPPG